MKDSDLRPLSMADIDDFDIELFEHHYLPNAVALEVVGQNKRKTKDQLKALRFLSPQGIPTILGMLVIGKESRNYIPGAYIQFLRIDGTELTDPIRSQKEISGPLNQLLGRLDDILEAHNNVSASITAGPVEIRHSDQFQVESTNILVIVKK